MNENRSFSPSASVVDGTSRALLIWACALAGLGILMGTWAIYQSTQHETETRMLEYYVMELDGKLMSAGVVEPHESWSAKKRKAQQEEATQ